MSLSPIAWAEEGPPPAGAPAKAVDEAAPITSPKPVRTPVEYPEGAAGEAEVVLDLTVAADGTIADAAVVSGAAPFDEAALEAVRAWRFEPATRQGRPIAARIRYTMRFEPSPDASPESPSSNVLPGQSAQTAGGAANASPPSAPQSEQPTEVVIRGTRRAAGLVTLKSGDVRSMPGAFGDPLRVVEAEPGVVPIVSGVPSFFIRGAPPANVAFFIDGIEVPILYHAFLGPSVIHPNVIDSVDFYRGAAPVEYGRFAGPTVAANLRPFDPDWHAQGNLRLIDVGGFVEAPFGDCDTPGSATCPRGNARASARYSYTGLVLSLLSSAALSYWDYQTEVHYALGKHDTLGVFAFGAFDYFRGTGDVAENAGGGRVTFHRVDLRWDHRFSPRTEMRFALTGGYDQSAGADDDSTSVSDRSLRARAQITSAIAGEAKLRTGFDARVDEFQLQTRPLTLSFPDFSVLFPSRTDLSGGAYVGVELAPTSSITVVPGVRADVYEVSGTTAVGVDPRISASFAVSSSVTIEHSLGIAHQRPNFAAQVPGAQVADLTGGLQEAVLWSSGVRWKLPEDVVATINVFRNGYFDALDPIGGARDFTLDRTILSRRSNIAAAGLEIGISRALTRKLGGFLSYTLSRSEESSGRRRSVSGFDRPHVLQAALSYDFGRGVRAGARAVLYSGVPELNLEGSPHFSTDRRGDPYFRLDMRVEKRWRVGEAGWWSAVGEILNATSTREVIRLDCGSVCVERFAGPVILPSVGVEAGF
jgi:TonB family protein